MTMPTERTIDRLRSVLREMEKGAYSRYSSGLSSALIDVMSPWLPLK
jgi:hypothetical protein